MIEADYFPEKKAWLFTDVRHHHGKDWVAAEYVKQEFLKFDDEGKPIVPPDVMQMFNKAHDKRVRQLEGKLRPEEII